MYFTWSTNHETCLSFSSDVPTNLPLRLLAFLMRWVKHCNHSDSGKLSLNTLIVLGLWSPMPTPTNSVFSQEKSSTDEASLKIASNPDCQIGASSFGPHIHIIGLKDCRYLPPCPRALASSACSTALGLRALFILKTPPTSRFSVKRTRLLLFGENVSVWVPMVHSAPPERSTLPKLTVNVQLLCSLIVFTHLKSSVQLQRSVLLFQRQHGAQVCFHWCHSHKAVEAIVLFLFLIHHCPWAVGGSAFLLFLLLLRHRTSSIFCFAIVHCLDQN